ncbi:hypothetical protein ASD00_31450 [Ensifer sp. Root31]|uniref:LysE family transporter n=1 Tax=Ensifer sp. Root31 TaxID=1736512 RepID=UPI00070E950A|nr:LysE family transporter [Ensifer sp. Root31]KQU86405.1 hypothetical protein ASD00_31450 [Ensifer sp. Root31]
MAASATPGPVNIIGAMTGARYGATRALAFVTGATASFLVLLLAFGTGMLAGTGWILALARPMTLIGSAYLLWMAWASRAMTARSSGKTSTMLPAFGWARWCRD